MSYRRKFDNAFKAKVVLEVLDGKRSANEVAIHYRILPSQISTWKSEFKEYAHLAFERNKKHKRTIEILQMCISELTRLKR